MQTFNLLDQPWILATDTSGNQTALSLVDIFAKAHQLKALSGEMPAQDIAVLRLLLGVLYAVYTRTDEYKAAQEEGSGDMAIEYWTELWEAGAFQPDIIESYLHQYHDRFWLVHLETDRPFWQVRFNDWPINSEGITIKPTELATVKFIGDIGNNANLFSGRSESYAIGFPEAARWLVHLNTYDVSPGGNPGKNPRSLKGFGHPWPADIGLVCITGNTLFETLMLNLVLTHNSEPWTDKDIAWWEKDPPGLNVNGLEQIAIARPEGIVELMTTQYRYVQLKIDNDTVTGFELWSGVKFEGENMLAEKMTPWKRDKDKNIVPCRHDLSKQMWRDFSSIVTQDKGYLPGVLAWVHDLRYAGVKLPFIRIQAVAIEYKKDTAIKDVFADSMMLNTGLLSSLDGWVKSITNSLEVTETLVKALGQLALEMALASGYSVNKKLKFSMEESKRAPAREEAYFRMDMPFRSWLAALDPRIHDCESECRNWLATARNIVQELGQELASQAGTSAFIGREEYSAPDVYVKFKRKIAKILRDAGFSPPTKEA